MTFQSIENSCYFRYRHINKYALEELETGRIWHSKVEHLNDPFEHPYFYDEHEFTLEHLDSFFELHLKGNEDYLSDMRNKGMEYSVYKHIKYWLIQYAPKVFDFQNTACVACFSGNPRDGIMWSQYADKLKGICIAYNKERLQKQKHFELIQPISYRKDVGQISYKDLRITSPKPIIGPLPERLAQWPLILPITDKQHIIINLWINTQSLELGFQKHSRWAYEDESRNVLLPKGDEKEKPGLFGLAGTDAIDAVIIGEKAEPDDLSRIIQFTDKRDIPLFYAHANKRTYQVEINTIPSA